MPLAGDFTAVQGIDEDIPLSVREITGKAKQISSMSRDLSGGCESQEQKKERKFSVVMKSDHAYLLWQPARIQTPL